MRCIQYLQILGLATGLAACQNSSDFEYHGPRVPAALLANSTAPEPQEPAATPAPSPDVSAASNGAQPPASEAAVAAEPGAPPASAPGRVLTPVPRARVDSPAGPIVVPAPERGRPVIVLEDTRTPTEVAEDKAIYDKCILKAAVRASEGQSPWAPPGPSAQEICAKQLGIRKRGEIPENRRR